MTDSLALKPCPFCGGDVVLDIHDPEIGEEPGDFILHVSPVRGPCPLLLGEVNAKHWNRRAPVGRVEEGPSAREVLAMPEAERDKIMRRGAEAVASHYEDSHTKLAAEMRENVKEIYIGGLLRTVLATVEQWAARVELLGREKP